MGSLSEEVKLQTAFNAWTRGQGESVKCINYVRAKMNFNLQDSVTLSEQCIQWYQGSPT
jgi:hypothetical protein